MGLKRFLYLLRIFSKLIKKNQNVKNNSFIEPEINVNHINISKQILDIVFTNSEIKDYMQYSSASEEDNDYTEFE